MNKMRRIQKQQQKQQHYLNNKDNNNNDNNNNESVYSINNQIIRTLPQQQQQQQQSLASFVSSSSFSSKRIIRRTNHNIPFFFRWIQNIIMKIVLFIVVVVVVVLNNNNNKNHPSTLFVHASYTITLKGPGDTECFWIRVPNGQISTISGNYDCWSDHERSFATAWIERQASSSSSSLAAANSADGGKSDNKNNNNNMLWHSRPGSREEVFEITSLRTDGKYMLCFEYTQRIIDREKVKEQQRKIMEEHRRNNKDGEEEGDVVVSFEGEDDDDGNADTESIVVGFHIRVENGDVRTLPDEESGPDAQRAIKLMESITDVEHNWENLLDHFDYLRIREASHTLLSTQINDRVLRWSLIEAFLVIGMAICQVLYWKKFFEQRRYL